MQHTTGVAVVATHLADTDRRALSQAWYSALHLAERAPSPHACGHAPPAPPPNALPPTRGTHACAQRPLGDGARNARGTPHAHAARPDADAGETDRRTSKSPLARRIERGLARRAPRGAATSFAVRTSGGRIHLVVRSDGDRTRVVAVCAPPLRERVERALAQARFALAGRGIRSEAA